ncbi:MAG: hypothetical protein JRI68_07270 [Deltaproteobacteria bacterium]|nr:hypothetical protein [Deltaproteobacteria bacterium]
MINSSSLARVLWVGVVLSLVALPACQCSDRTAGPPIPASSDPEGRDLVEGAIVLATAKQGGVRIYKIKGVNYFPPPMGDELVMIAFTELGNDFEHAAKLWRQRKLTVVLPNVRVQQHMFNRNRDYRIIGTEPVTDQEKKLQIGDALPPKP